MIMPICEFRVRLHVAGCIERVHAALSAGEINVPIFYTFVLTVL
jgi:hypothetical protein